MFDNLSEKLKSIIAEKSGTLTEENTADAIREVRRALLEADVNISVVKAFILSVKEKIEGTKSVSGVNLHNMPQNRVAADFHHGFGF